jgi:replicative superfamily II helicase
MNTGSGKMLVGLLLLQSSLNEGLGPAVYICPDNHLVEQVIKEAADLGVITTKDPRDPKFLSGNVILIINIDKLVNGRSVFGVGSQGAVIPIGTLIFDDAQPIRITFRYCYANTTFNS